jgi:hypothetical protein
MLQFICSGALLISEILLTSAARPSLPQHQADLFFSEGSLTILIP